MNIDLRKTAKNDVLNCVMWIQFHCIHKKDGIYKDIAEDVETRFDTSNYELDRPLPKGKK